MRRERSPTSGERVCLAVATQPLASPFDQFREAPRGSLRGRSGAKLCVWPLAARRSRSAGPGRCIGNSDASTGWRSWEGIRIEGSIRRPRLGARTLVSGREFRIETRALLRRRRHLVAPRRIVRDDTKHSGYVAYCHADVGASGSSGRRGRATQNWPSGPSDRCGAEATTATTGRGTREPAPRRANAGPRGDH